ncbi:hypothetical protein FRC01_006388, partial [Tulasnella sp. 417]
MYRPKRSNSLPETWECIPHFELGWPFSVLSRSDRRHYLLLSQQDTLAKKDQFPNIRAQEELSKAAYKVGQIRELVELILSFASKHLLSRCMLVFKAYNQIAKKYLWQELRHVGMLLNLLGTITPIGEACTPSSSWDLDTPPTDSQWENFDAYAQYVKSITSWSESECNGTTELRHSEELDCAFNKHTHCGCLEYRTISRAALAMLEARQKKVSHPASPSVTRCSLLPNLERLTFVFKSLYTTSTAFLPFIGPKLVTLDLLYHLCPEDVASGRLIALMSESLGALALFFSTHGPLPFLKRLKIGMKIVHWYSRRPEPDLIHQAFTMYGAIDDVLLNVLGLCPHLQYLELPPFSKHKRLLGNVLKLPLLTDLAVSFQNSEEMMLFAEGLASSHVNLRKLRLGHYGECTTPVRVLQPLRKLRHLEELSIKSYLGHIMALVGLPWNLCPSLLHELSDAWPKLESLTLCPSPSISIQTLESFRDSNLFFHLTHLDLRVDNLGREPPTLTEVSTTVRLIQPLRSLKTLAMEIPGFLGSTS